MTAKLELKTASGGKVILDPTDTAVDRTLTLPALSGSFVTANTSGNVGIGTSSPASRFVVSNAGANGFEFDPASGIIQAFNRSTVAYTDLNQYGSFVRFYTGASPSERARITSDGDLLVGTTSAAQDTAGVKILSTGRLFATGASDAVFYRQSATDPVIQFRSNNSSTNRLVATVEASGTFNTISDRSVKKNIENLTETLPKLMQVLPVAFNWMSDQDGSDKTVGFVAQDVEAIYPQLITERDGQKMLNTTGFVPFLVKAIQELKAEVDSLKSQLNSGA